METQLPIRVILPAFNEATVIASVIQGVQKYTCYPVVVIDDGSTDDTALVAKEAGALVVKHPINRGAGAACMTGIELARRSGWPLVAFMDADGQHFAEDLQALYQAQREYQADLVIGSRFLTEHEHIPRLRRFFNGIANGMTNIFCRHKYSDTQSGMRLLARPAIDTIVLQQDDFSYCSEMILLAEKLSLRVAEAAIRVRYTTYSVSKGQDFQVGLLTAFHFFWKVIFK